MIQADVVADGTTYRMEIARGTLPRQVHTVWMGRRNGQYIISGQTDWGNCAGDFCRQIRGPVQGASAWSVELHICGLVFPFGDVRVRSGSGPEYTPIQLELVELWRKYGRRGSVDTALQTLQRIVEVGGWHDLNGST